MNHSEKKIFQHCLGYLCGGPRVSTLPDAEISGARAHVLGTIRSFESLGWKVLPFIVGDHVPRKWVGLGSGLTLSSMTLSRLFADFVRFGVGVFAAQIAWWQLRGRVNWVYERLSAFQSLGWIFKCHGIPWILETNAPLFYEGKFDRKATVLDGFARRIEIQAYRECNILVCVCETLKEIIVKEANISSEKVIVIPNGVDTDFFNPELYEPKCVSSVFTIGFVGALATWMGLDVLLEALCDLSIQGLKLSLVVVGDGSERIRLEELVQKLGISKNVTFVGQVFRDDVPRYISGFDVGYCGHVLTKFGKMYFSPLKLYEYMAMAKPVIASAFEDAQRVVKENETGFLYQAGDKEDLKRVLIQAYQSRNRLPEMGRRARSEMISKHSWDARVQLLINEIERRLK